VGRVGLEPTTDGL